MTPKGLALLRAFEGVRTHVYRDVARLPTIGVGHCLTKTECHSGKIRIGAEWVRYAQGLTEAQIDDLLQHDLGLVEAIVDTDVRVPLTPYQRDSLISLCFNIGMAAFARSTLIKQLNAGHYEAVPDEIRRWTYSAGQIIPGLVRRRAREAVYWQGGEADE
jgi:lysozyme